MQADTVDGNFELADEDDGLKSDAAIGDKKEDNKKEDNKKLEPKSEPKRFDNIREAINDAKTKVQEKEDNNKKKFETGREKELEIKPTEKVETKKYKAPNGWDKEAKEIFESLPEAVKASIAKREDEVSKGFKESGEKLKTIDQYENIVKKYVPNSQSMGTAPQIVERTLQWFNALQHPNRAHATASLKEVAKTLGFTDAELQSVFAPNQPAAQPDASKATAIPAEIQPVIQRLENEISQLKSAHTQNEQKTSQQVIENWAKDKPHFDKVRTVMHAMLANGVVPMDDFTKALDESYSRAVRQDPDLYQTELEAVIAKEQARILDEQKKASEKAQAEINRSRNANVSLKTGSSHAPAKSTDPKNFRKESPRESINRALAEIRGT